MHNKIVANKDTGIDVDKWDYYQRDCRYLGILQDFQWRYNKSLAYTALGRRLSLSIAKFVANTCIA
jgi:HD superfamily phosphohydrolase